MSDLPIDLPPATGSLLAAAFDREGKISRCLETLGPIADRDVVVIGGGTAEIARLAEAGVRATNVKTMPGDDSQALPDGGADAIVTSWAGFRGVEPAALAEADRILRPGGKLLVVHDYGRDDVSRLRGDRPEYGAWSRRNGPFLANGFRMRVLHCFWTFDTIEVARSFLAEAFGPEGEAVGAGLKRPRLTWNVAVYHRAKDGAMEPPTGAPAASEVPGAISAEGRARP
ncbi:MAG: hypothetical protein H0U52_00225 [Chloroflexi bacterium]|nr:hypothetical protein [Chloroflexota bacterium]